MPETRISAQIRPSTVDSSSEPIVTRIVSADALQQDRQELGGVSSGNVASDVAMAP